MAFNALMPGEHDWMKNARMSSSATPGYTPPQDDFASLMVSLGGSPSRAPKPAPAQAPQKKSRPILNALGTYLQFAAPEQYEAGRTARINRDYQNALAGGDMEKAAQYRLQMGDFEGAKQIQDYTTGQADAARKQEAQGVYQLFTSMQPAQINEYAMQDPAGFERMTGMTSEEYLASAQQMQQVGMTPEQFHQYVIGKAQAELGMEPAGPVEGKVVNNRLVNPYTGEEMGNYSDPATRYRVLTDEEVKNYGLPTGSGYQMNEATGQIEALGRSGPMVEVNTGANGPEIGAIPQGYAVVRDSSNPSGYRLEAIPGGPAGTEAQGAATARRSLENTFRTLFLNYKDLADKGAIRDSSAGVASNVGAYIQSSPVGREIGKMVGAPAEAMRETIEALQPAISQAIMSQPGMSARSMDSERELQFFIRSITAPTADVWANYATLHALDNRFGSGQLMNSLLQSGEISQADYDKITRSPRVAAITGAMDAKINELFTSEQGMADILTPEDAAELEALRRWKKDRGIP